MYKLLQEIQKFHVIPQPKIPQKRLKITKEMMLKKQLTQEAKSTTYAQTQTLITQTHTGIKKTNQRLQLNKIVSFFCLYLLFYWLSTEVENLIFFSL